ncbi:MAG: ABC transporter permease [Acidimicrobiales bacterium]|nr:ABC transporter permease [Acidimicrobiales bacterium]
MELRNEDDGLIELGQSPPLRQYLSDLWARREFAFHLPMADLRTQNLDKALGQLWHLLNPAFMIAVYYLVFKVLLDVTRGVENYIAFLTIGILLFTLMMRVVTDGLNCMLKDKGLILSVHFPRALMPVTTVVGQTLAFLPSAVVMLVAIVITGSPPRWQWIFFIPIFGLITVMNLGVAFITARAGHAVRDLSMVVQNVSRLLFYASGALFPVSRFVDDDFYLSLFNINPIYDVLEMSRWALIGTELSVWTVVWAVGWTVFLVPVGLRFFMAAEHNYGRQ